MADLVGLLRDEKRMLEKKLSGVSKALEAMTEDVTKSVKRTTKNVMSAATKAKLSKAAKARWAAIKKKV